MLISVLLKSWVLLLTILTINTFGVTFWRVYLMMMYAFLTKAWDSLSLSLSYFVLIIYLVSQIMGYKIFTHEIHSSYAARVDNFRSYDTVSKDIIQRWTYPLVPDVQFSAHGSTKLERHGIYRASGKFFFVLFEIQHSFFSAAKWSLNLFPSSLCLTLIQIPKVRRVEIERRK